jgi:hypothetical protein
MPKKPVPPGDLAADFEKYADQQIGKNLTNRDNWQHPEIPESREEIAAAAFHAGARAAERRHRIE